MNRQTAAHGPGPFPARQVTSQASPSALQSEPLALRLAELPHLTMTQLWRLWDEYFDERPNHHHRTWLESRLAYRMQERAYGALKPLLRRKLETIGETGLLPGRLQNQADQLLPGTELRRSFDNVEHRVIVHGVRDFEYRGQRFKSLSAIARVITGCTWSGPVFFGLKESGKRTASGTSSRATPRAIHSKLVEAA
jgi:hypothetical protein